MASAVLPVSGGATVRLVTPPAITLQPVGQRMPEGSAVTLTVAASGDGLSYQWFRGPTRIDGAMGASLTLTNLTAVDSGMYTVAVTNAVGAVVSDGALVVGSSEPPGELWVNAFNEGSILRFDTATKAFLGNLVKGIPGGLQNFEIGFDGMLYCASAFSNSVYRVDPANGKILGQFIRSGAPANLNNTIGLAWGPNARLYVGSWGNSQILSFDGLWGLFTGALAGRDKPVGFIGGNDLQVGRDGTLFASSYGDGAIKTFSPSGEFLRSTVPARTKGLNNLTAFTVLVDGSFIAADGSDRGSVYHLDAASGLIDRVFIPNGTGGLRAPGGMRVGPDGLLYVVDYANAKVLRFNGVSGEFIDRFDRPPSSGGDWFWVRLAPSNASAAPRIMWEPADTLGVFGATQVLSITVSGTPPLGFQWRRGGIPIASATSSSLPVVVDSPEARGAYDVIVTNSYGAVTSRVAQVTKPVMTVQFATNAWTVNELRGVLTIPFLRTGGTNALILGVTFGGNAVANVDYRGFSPSVSAGQSIGGVSVRILDDTVANGPRTLTITLTAGEHPNVVVGSNATATVTIEDNDTAAGAALGLDGGVRVITALPDGRALVAGDFESVHGVRSPRLARLLPDLSLDATFQPGSFLEFSSLRQVLVQPDGGLVLRGGGFPVTKGASQVLRRLHSDGSEDLRFTQLIDSNNGSPTVRQIQVDANGWLYLSGIFPSGTGTAGEIRSLQRRLPDGSLDPLFTANFANDPVIGSSGDLCLMWDGRVILGGSFTNAPGLTNRGGIARFMADGRFDPTFATGAGLRNTAARGGAPSVGPVEVDPLGRVLVAGSFNRFGTNEVKGWTRLNPDGSLDPSFNPSESGTLFSRLKVLRDGRILSLRSTGSLELFRTDGARSAVLASGVAAFAEESAGTLLVGGSSDSPALRLWRIELPDADPGSRFELGWGRLEVLESEPTVRVPVWRSGEARGEVEIPYRIVVETARAGIDLIPTHGLVRFAPGVREAFVVIPLSARNEVPNDDRTFRVELLSAAGVDRIAGRTDCLVTIRDDDVGLTVETFAAPSSYGVTSQALHTNGERLFQKPIGSFRDEQVVFEWNGTGHHGSAREYFGALWTGWLVPEVSGEYRLATASDDGSRLWVDDQLIVANWLCCGSKPGQAVRLEAGRAYRLEMSHWENVGAAYCKLLWIVPGTTNLTFIPRSALRPGMPRLIPPTVDFAWLEEPQQSFRLDYTAEPGRPIGIESTTNGVDWLFVAEAVSPAPGVVSSFTNDLTRSGTNLLAGSWLRAVSVDGVATTNFNPLPLVIRITQSATHLVEGRTNSLTLRALANGGPTQTFTWLREGREVATGPTLVLNGTQPEAPGTYEVMVNSPFGQRASPPRSVRWLTPPLLAAPLQERALLKGEKVSVSSGVDGLELVFAWFKDGVRLARQTNALLEFNPVEWGNAGAYSVVVSNRVGAVTNGPAVLQVLAPPQPKGSAAVATTVAGGASVTLSTQVEGTEPMVFQWRHNGLALPGAVNRTLTIPAFALADAGSYTWVAANPFGSVESAAELVSLEGLPPLPLVDRFAERNVSNAPRFLGIMEKVAATRETGETAHAGRIGEGTLWLAWRAPSSGVATFRTVGSSVDTLLAVYTGTEVTGLTEVASDDDRGGFLTSELRFHATAGQEYQVAVDGFAIRGATIVLGWNLEESNSPLPSILRQPADVLEHAGRPVKFQVAAGPPEATYQWFLNGNPLPGEIREVLSIPAVGPAQVGTYQVRVTAPGGLFVDSREAMLEVTTGLSGDPGAISREKLLDLFADNPAGQGVDFTPVGLGEVGTRFMDLSGSSTEPGDPLPCDLIVAGSRWLRFRAAGPSLRIAFTTTQAGFDTVLAVYTNRFAPVLVACNDDMLPEVRTSRVAFAAELGVDYWVMLAGKDDVAGGCGLSWSATAGSFEIDPFSWETLGMVDGRFSFRRVVPPGLYQISRGNSLEEFVPLQRLRVRSGLLEFQDPDPVATGARFFRYERVSP